MENAEFKLEEYKSLRTEMLQHIQDYQNVRNMMYLVALTMIGFFIKKDVNVLYFLSPSIIIIPSYFVAMNSWHTVTKISTYINVFYEQDNGCINWENRNFDFKKHNEKITKMSTNLMSYLLMQFFCAILYFAHVDYDSTYAYGYIFGGLFFVAASILIFHLYGAEMGDCDVEFWKNIKSTRGNRNGL